MTSPAKHQSHRRQRQRQQENTLLADHHRTHVVECSSYQIDLAPTLDPSVGVLINLSEDHLDRHGTMDNYAATKERLVAGVQPGGTAVIGVDDNRCQAIADRLERAGRKVVRVSVRRPLPDGVYVEAEQVMLAAGGTARPVALLGGIGSLRGRHNAQNAACAVAAALALGLDHKAIQNGLWSFPGLAHRMEEVGRKGNVLFVNDSKATNADSAAQALACFSDIYWILGGKPKTGGIESLASFFPRIRKAYLIGDAAEAFAATLAGKGRARHRRHARSRHRGGGARCRGVGARQSGGAAVARLCVLRPVRNFEVRGDTFRKLVKALPGVAGATVKPAQG